jgi:hypothetical protein
MFNKTKKENLIMKTSKIAFALLAALPVMAATPASASNLRCESRIAKGQYFTFSHAGGTEDRPMVLEISHPALGPIILNTEANIPLRGKVELQADGQYLYTFGMLFVREASETEQIDYVAGYTPSAFAFHLELAMDGAKVIDSRESIELRFNPSHPESSSAVLIRSDRSRNPFNSAGVLAHWDKPFRTEMPVSCVVSD